ncbi:MAG: hypothetical protein Q9214_000334 [Letrouitia sp. 1 TL-2023]
MQMPQTPISEGLMTGQTEWLPPVPTIDEDESLSIVIRELSQILKLHFHSFEPDDRGVYETRGWACEIVAWRFLSHLSENELINYLLCELAPTFPSSNNTFDVEEPQLQQSFGAGTPAKGPATERTRLLFDERTMPAKVPDIHVLPQSQTGGSRMSESIDDDPAMYFVGLNALEIATIAGAKRFLSQRVVQNVINGIWNGDIIFWDSLNPHTRKKAQFYHKK